MSQDVSQPCSKWFLFLPNEWKRYLAKWVWGTNCTYHQKSSLENSFQTYAWGNEPVSLLMCQSTLCYSGCVSQAGIAFLMCSLLVCSESVSAQSQAAFVRSCWAAPAIPRVLLDGAWSASLLLLSSYLSHLQPCLFSAWWEMLAAGKGSGTIPELLPPLPGQKHQQ